VRRNNSQAKRNYYLVGNDSLLQENISVTNLLGAGTAGDLYLGNANLDPMTNLNTNSLPRGIVVDSSSTCKTNGAVITLESGGADCQLVLVLNRTILATLGGAVLLNFTTPTVSWATSTGFYRTGLTYVTYHQPSVMMSLSNNNASFL